MHNYTLPLLIIIAPSNYLFLFLLLCLTTAIHCLLRYSVSLLVEVAEEEEKLRRQEEEKATLLKLQKIIEKEKKREKMGPKLEKKR